MQMTTATDDDPRRRPKGHKRQRTRERLLEAARELTRQNGYEKTTLEDIARHAGMTTGAIYSNFRNRDDLYIALAEAYWPTIVPSVSEGDTLAEIMREIASATLATLPDRQMAAVGYFTGRAYAMSHENVRLQASEQTAKSYDAGAAWLSAKVKDDSLPLPADTMVRVIHALSEGLILQRLLTPELVSDEVFVAAFELLAGAVSQKERPMG